MVLAAALALALHTLPPAEQYTFESFPRSLQAELRQRQRVEQHRLAGSALPAPLWLVWRLPAGKGATTWVLGEGCDPEDCRSTLVFLQRGLDFVRAGAFDGTAADALGDGATPPELVLTQRSRTGTLERLRIVYRDGAYKAGRPEERFEDPLTRALVSRAELNQTANDDFVAGRDVSAAGRWSVLCKAGCTPAQHAKQGRAALRAGLFPQAERALRDALAGDSTLDVTRLDLGDVLATEGKLGEARAMYQAAARSRDSSLADSAKGRLAKLPR